jgi:hypothetical protein
MTDVDGLINKHRGTGLFIDTNLLLMYLVGQTNRDRIPIFKRTRQHTPEDFDLLERLTQFDTLVTTLHVLTEGQQAGW